MKIRLFSGRLLISFIAFLLFASSELPSSSRAEDGFWLARSQSGLERLWSDVLGCAESTDSFAIRNRFNDSEDTNGGASSTGTSIDYSQCGKRALRNTSSRMLVDTIEDAVRSGGVALFSEHFRLDSSVGWVWGENVSGEFDAVVPLFSRERSNGTGQALFVQTGAVFWRGLKEQDRVDGNFGLAYRQHLTPGVVAGGSVFYDYDFKREHQRVGLGADLQSGALHTALNYYHPLNEWQEGRTDYEEQPLQGADLRLELIWSRVQVDTGIGVWRFEGEEDDSTKWRPSFDVGAGYRIYPGVFLEGGYEKHDSGDSLGSRWNAGLAFRFSLPELQGVKSYETMAEANLWEPVEREKRILYEERLGIPRVNLSATEARVAEPKADDSGTTIVTVEADLGKPLNENVMLHIMIAETSTATLGTDFTYGHKVYEPGEQSAPAGDATPCPEDPMMVCKVMIPAGVTRFNIEAEIAMTMEREVREFIDFQIEVPEKYAGLLRGSVVERVAIEAHGNTVEFTEATSTLAEDNETDGIQVAVSIDEPSPTPITLNVATSGTAMEGEDYRISTRSLVIPANASSASLTLRGIDNTMSGGSKQIVLTLSGSLPEGWDFGPVTDPANPPETITHTVNLRDDDLSVGFARDSDTIAEPASDTPHTIEIEITQAPAADVTLQITRATASTADTTGSNIDVTFSPSTVTFMAGTTTLKQTVTLDVKADAIAEGAEFIELELGDSGNTLTSNGNAFSFGRQTYRLNINGSDNTVGFTSGTADTLGENGGTADVEVSISNSASADIRLNVSVDTTNSTATQGTDFTLSPSTLRIPAGQTTGTITLTGINNNNSEGSKNIALTISVNGSLPNGWTLGTATHTVTLQDDDLSVGFVRASDTIDEPASDTDHTVDIEITQAPIADVILQITRATASTAASTGSNTDVTFSPPTVTFMAGTTTLKQTVTLDVKADTVPEGAEFIELELGDSGNTLTGGGNAFSFGRQTYRLNINANDNTVGFASDAATTLNENGGTASVGVSISNFAPADIMLNVSVDTTNSTATETTDFTLSPSALTISQGQTSGTITLTGINNDSSEGSKNIALTLSVVGNLPNGWALGTATHTVTLQDDDLSVGFVRASDTIDEPASDTDHTIDIEITQAPAANVTLQITRASASTADTTGTDIDVTFSPSTVTFMAGTATLKQTVTLNVKHDTVPEEAEFIELELGDSGNTLKSGGNAFSFGRQKYRLNINANDITRVSVSTDRSDFEGAQFPTRPFIGVSSPLAVDIKVNLMVSSDSTAVAGDDYTDNIPSLITLPDRNSSVSIPIDITDDGDDEPVETVIFEISEPSGADEWPEGVVLSDRTRVVYSIVDNDVEANTIGFNRDRSETSATEGAGEFNTGNAFISLEIAENLPSDTDVTVTITGVSDASGFTFYESLPMIGPQALPSNVITIPMGARTFDFNVTAPEDDDSNDENITLTLSGTLPSGWSFGSTYSPTTWNVKVDDSD